MPNKPNSEQLTAENEDLRARLEKAEDSLREILSGEADALFVSGVGGAQLFTLKGADQSYRTLIENMSEGALTLTQEGLVLYANRRFAGMLRMPLEKLIGSEIYTWFAPESRQVLRTLLRKEAADNHREELVLAAADGTQVPVYLSVSRLLLDGMPDSFCMVATDLTEQKRNEAILAAEKLSRAILEQAADAIVICDETGLIMRASKQAQALYGKNPIGQLFEQVYPLRQLDGAAFSAVGAIDTNHPVEARLECNGHGFDLLVSVGHLKGARNELLGSVVTLTDITEHRQTEKHLKLFRTLLDNSSDAIEVLEPVTLRLLDVNETECRDLGYSREELLSMKITDIDWGLNAELNLTIEAQIRQSGGARFESVHRRKDGSTFPVEVSAKLIELDKPYGLNIVRDITERKQAETELRWRTAFFEAVVNTSADGILVVDTKGKKILQNRRAIDLWKIPEEIAADPDDSRQMQFVINQIVDAKKFGEKVLYLYAHPEETSLDEVVLKDGTIIDRYSAPVLDSGGHSYGRIWSFRDITERKQAEQALRTSEVRFKTMFMQAPFGIALIGSLSGHIYEANSRFAEIAGRSMGELANIDWLQITHPDDVQADLDNMALLNAGKINEFQMEKRYRHPDGTTVWIDMIVTHLKVEDKTHPRHLCMIQNITARKEAEHRIAYLNRVYAVLSDINSLIVRVRDRNELFREACQIAVEKGGFQIAVIAIVDQTAMQIVPVASAGVDEQFLTLLKSRFSLIEGAPPGNPIMTRVIREKMTMVINDLQSNPEVVFRKQYAEAGVRSVAILPLIVSDEAVGMLVLFANEIEFFHEEEIKLLTELAGDIAYSIDHIVKQEQLDYLAYYDVLTGLANRRLFLERVALYMRNAASGGHKIALLLIDLERFKNINDSLGRPAGDALLKQVAEWLKHNMGGANLLARVGADHFAIVVPEVKHEGDLPKLFDKKSQAFLDHPFHLNDAVFRIAAKAGIALFPDDGADADTLYKNAEAALKKAKASGDRYLFYTQKMTEAVAGKLTLENQLRQAIDNEEFVLHYQPKVNLASGKVTSAEALIRWNDPRTGLVPPGRFIPILEETGLIYEVGRWALHKAIADYLRWRAAGLAAVRIAVNVSALQLHNPGFIAEIEQAIAIDAHAADGLELEITESLIMEDVKHCITTLQAIRAMGITIAIDDFGTGFSSLSYLAKLPVDTLKIDRSFVIEMAAPEGLALVSTIIILAHALKLKTVAEGVETEEQASQLRSLSCDEMQGYLFSKPVPVDIFEAKFLASLTLGTKE